jgi:hypothetical protein
MISMFMALPVNAEMPPSYDAVTYMVYTGDTVHMDRITVDTTGNPDLEAVCPSQFNAILPQIQFVHFQSGIVVLNIPDSPQETFSFVASRSGHYFVRYKCPWRNSYEYPKDIINPFWVFAWIKPASNGGFE